MKATFFITTLAAATLWLPVAGGREVPAQERTLDREEAQAYLATQSKLNADGVNLYRQLVRKFTDKSTYTVAEIKAITEPGAAVLPTKPRQPSSQTGNPPQDTFGHDTVQQRFAALTVLDPENAALYPRLIDRYGKQSWYTPRQVRDVEATAKYEEPTPEARAMARAVDTAVRAGRKHELYESPLIRAPRIRHDWSDVLYDEDQSQKDNETKALSDLVGAQFAFTHDGKAGSDTWAAHGAVIWPLIKSWEPSGHFSVTRFSMAPSVTVDRVTTNGDPAAETDTVLYRIGAYLNADGLLPLPGGGRPSSGAAGAEDDGDTHYLPFGVQLRAAGVHISDMDNRSGLQGFELDVEPRILGKNLRLGYRKILRKKEPIKPDYSDTSFAEYQLRVWLHVEGGDIQDVGAAWLASPESFLRMGPTAELKFQLPALPGDRALSLTVLCSYLAAISGPSDHPWYFHSTLAYDLFRDVELNHKVAITVDYERGGLNFTKEEVDQFTIGLGVLF